MPGTYGNDNDNILFISATNIYGGDGNDYMGGTNTASDDGLYGGSGNDVILSGNYSDYFFAGSGVLVPTAFYPSGNDYMEGGQGSDSLYGADGNDALFGGDGDDGGVITIYNGTLRFLGGLRAGDGDDYLDGGRGADELYGENGIDTMVGGEGPDKFFFTTALNPVTNLDTIKDFEPGIDKIVLSQAIFTDIGPTFDKKEFYAGKKAHDGNDRIIYNEKNGKLFSDHDGQGGDGKVQFALLGKHLDPHFSDFLLTT